MKSTFLNRKEAQQRAGITIKAEMAQNQAQQQSKVTMANAAFG
jgi:hypothetical protein